MQAAASSEQLGRPASASEKLDRERIDRLKSSLNVYGSGRSHVKKRHGERDSAVSVPLQSRGLAHGSQG